MGALSAKTVLLVTHQVDFLPAFHSILVSPHIMILLHSCVVRILDASCFVLILFAGSNLLWVPW